MSPSSVRAARVLVFALVVVVPAAAAQPASAQSAPRGRAQTADPAQPQADALFAEGRDLLEKGRFSEACARLARSEELSPAVGTLLNLGYCYEQVGQLRSAMDAYSEADVLATAAGETKRAAFAKERFAAVEPRAPKLVVRVTAPEPPGLAIARNSIALGKTDLDHPIAVDPQDLVITASAPGHVPWRGAFIVRGEGAVVTVIVPPLDPVAAAPAAAPVAPTSIGVHRVAALGLGVLSALAIGAGIGAGIGAKSRYDDSSSHCDETGCDETGTSIQRGAVAQGNVATGLVGFGALCAGAGIYLWIVGAPESKRTARSVRVDVHPLGAGLGGRF